MEPEPEPPRILRNCDIFQAGWRIPGRAGSAAAGRALRPPAGQKAAPACALAAALLRAPGAFAGEWGPGAGRGLVESADREEGAEEREGDGDGARRREREMERR